MVCTSTFAPVAASKPSMTLSGVFELFCAAQMVRVVPVRSASCSGQVTGPLLPPPVPGSLHAVRVSTAMTAAAVAPVFQVIFIGRPLG